jgi:hypothetical protein
VSKTRVGVRCHTRKKDDFNQEKKGYGDFFQNKSGILKGVSARYKTKKPAWILGFFGEVFAVFESKCHIFGVM